MSRWKTAFSASPLWKEDGFGEGENMPFYCFPVILLFLPLSLSAETELEFGGFADTAYGAAVTGGS